MTDSVQPGYDALAARYARELPSAFVSPLERATVDAFAEHVREAGLGRRVVDVGCGIGHVAAHLTSAGFTVTAVEPSAGMRGQARAAHPDLELVADDASLTSVDLSAVAGVLARFSLIHVEPDAVRAVLRDWAARLSTDAVVLLAGQSTDDPGVVEFDHLVARAWRWHPDAISQALTDASFAELWRTVARPSGGHGRFPEFHVCAVRAAPVPPPAG